MEIKDLSDFIGMLRKKRKLTIASLAEAIPISPQGLHNWIYKRKDVNWKIQSLIELTSTLQFKITISNGTLNVKENEIMKQENVVTNLNYTNDTLQNSEGFNEPSQLEVYKNFGNMTIYKVYTPNSNLSDDIEPKLLEEWMYFYNKDDCEFEYPNCKPIQIYVLMEHTEDEEFIEKKISVTPYDVETFYYLNYAPVLDNTSDGFEIIVIDNKNEFKIVKAYAEIKILNGDAFVQDYFKEDNNKTLLGLVVMPLDGSKSEDFKSWHENIKCLYEEIKIEEIQYRYFDRSRNEILEGSKLEMTGYEYHQLGLDYDECIYNETYDNDFSDNEIINIVKYENKLFYFRKENEKLEPLENLKLLKWKIA